MISRFFLIFIALHWLVIAVSWLAGLTHLFVFSFVQVSPVWIYVYAANPKVMIDGEGELPMFFFFCVLFCLFKYFTLLKAVVKERLNPINIISLVLELAYVLASGLYLGYHHYL